MADEQERAAYSQLRGKRAALGMEPGSKEQQDYIKGQGDTETKERGGGTFAASQAYPGNFYSVWKANQEQNAQKSGLANIK